MIPATQVGGDLFDFSLLDDHRLMFAIGDVSGKGVAAAMLMAVTRTLLRAAARKGMGPGECLHEVNQVLRMERVSSMFVTAFVGVLDARTGEVERGLSMVDGIVLLVRPVILKLQGATALDRSAIPTRASFNWKKPDRRREFLRVRRNASGELELFENQSSGVLTSSVWGDGLVDVAPGRVITAGEPVPYLPFAELL